MHVSMQQWTWDTAELWPSVHECSTISTYMSSPKHSQSEYTLWKVWWKSILVVPLTHPPRLLLLHLSPATFPYISLLLQFPWIPLNMPRTQQKGITTRVSYPEGPTLEHRGMDHDIEPFSSIHSSEIWEPWRKNTAYKPNRHRICFQLKTLVKFECFPMWFLSYLIKSDGIYRRNVPIFLCCK